MPPTAAVVYMCIYWGDRQSAATAGRQVQLRFLKGSTPRRQWARALSESRPGWLLLDPLQSAFIAPVLGHSWSRLSSKQGSLLRHLLSVVLACVHSTWCLLCWHVCCWPVCSLRHMSSVVLGCTCVLQVMEDEGVIAPLNQYVQVYLNGQFYGLYGMIERVRGC